MKLQFTRHDLPTKEELEAATGLQVREFTSGWVETGWEESHDHEGNPVTIPIRERGVEVEFTRDPNPAEQARLETKLREFNLNRKEPR